MPLVESRENAPRSLKKLNSARFARPWALGGAEAHRAEEPGQVGDVVVHQVGLAQLAHLLELRDHEQAQHVGLALLERAAQVLERVAHRALAVERVLDAEPVRHLVEHHVGEEGVELDVRLLVRGDEPVGDGREDLVELGAHGVLELQAPRALRELDRLVVRQVDGDGLRRRRCVAGVVDDVVGAEVRVAARATPACTRPAPAAASAARAAASRSARASRSTPCP